MSSVIPRYETFVDKMIQKPTKGNTSDLKFGPNITLEVIWYSNEPYIFWKGSWVHVSQKIMASDTSESYSDSFAESALDIFKKRYEVTDSDIVSKITALKDESDKQKDRQADSESKKKKELVIDTNEEGSTNSFLGWMVGSKRVSTVYEGSDDLDLPEEDEQEVIVAQPINSPRGRK